MEFPSDLQQRVEVALHDFLEARQVGPDVGGSGHPVGPDQVEGFLVVGAAPFVEGLDARADVTAIAAESADRQRALGLVGLREEGRTGRESVDDRRRRHAVAGDDEKAHLAASAADERGNGAPGCTVAGPQVRDVDGRDALHGVLAGPRRGRVCHAPACARRTTGQAAPYGETPGGGLRSSASESGRQVFCRCRTLATA